jgi:hypothetical protein
MRPSDPATPETAGGGAYMQMAARQGRPCAAAPGGEHMIRKTRLAAALAFGAGLTAAGVALAQTQTGSAAPPPASAQPAPPPTQSETPTFKPSDSEFSQPKYSVDPPPDSSSGLYLPAVVGGYAKSVAGCVVVGCDDGPQVGGAPGPATSAGPAEPPPANPGPSDPR